MRGSEINPICSCSLSVPDFSQDLGLRTVYLLHQGDLLNLIQLARNLRLHEVQTAGQVAGIKYEAVRTSDELATGEFGNLLSCHVEHCHV